jgi:hypothetical protein
MKFKAYLLVVVVAYSFGSFASEVNLFEYVDNEEVKDILSKKKFESIHKKEFSDLITINKRVLSSDIDAFDVEMKDIGLLKFNKKKQHSNHLGQAILRATTNKLGQGRLTLVANNEGGFVGSLFVEGKVYDILPLENGYHIIRLNEDATSKNEEPIQNRNDEDSVYENIYESSSLNNSTLTATNVIDILVLYTDDAETAMGSSANIEARIALMHDQINTAMENNNVDSSVQARLVYVGPTSYDESLYDYAEHLDNLANDTVPDVSDLKEAFGADIVALIVADNEYCGIANLQPNNSNSVMVVRYACTNYTYPHEFGHLIGMRHNYEEDSTSSYNHGYLLEGELRTILSYNSDNTNTTRIPYWSTDDQSVNGFNIGNSSLADNERKLLARAATVSNFEATKNFEDAPVASITWANCYGNNRMSWTSKSGASFYKVYQSSSADMTNLIYYATFSGTSGAAHITSGSTQPYFALEACVTDDACSEMSNSVIAKYIPRCAVGGPRT